MAKLVDANNAARNELGDARERLDYTLRQHAVHSEQTKAKIASLEESRRSMRRREEAAVEESARSMLQINEGNPVSLNMVNEYTRLYTKDQLQLVPQESPWGFTENAEIINGRIAMAAVTAATAFTLDPTLKAVAAAYRAARDAVS